jgi:hypothetical protein
MTENNIILDVPFDESKNSQVAYDYSKNRTDGQVVNAIFAQGKSGNCIVFDGNGYCSVNQNQSPLIGDFTVLFWVKRAYTDTDSGKKIGIGFDTDTIFWMEIPEAWVHIAVVREQNERRIYLNASLQGTVPVPETISEFFIAQDNDDSVMYAQASVDDFIICDMALSQPELSYMATYRSNKTSIVYLLDGIDFKTYGVYVSGSDGVVGRPKLKKTDSFSWDNYHGESVDLAHKFYEPREITLDCFIVAENRNDFIGELSAFEQQFDKAGTNRLYIEAVLKKPLIYEVYCKDGISVSKKWSGDTQTGTFKLKLTEPEPVKRILRHTADPSNIYSCNITLTSEKLINIYWGDGTADYDVSGENIRRSHQYADEGVYYPVVTGCIDEISAFATNAIIVWSKL